MSAFCLAQTQRLLHLQDLPRRNCSTLIELMDKYRHSYLTYKQGLCAPPPQTSLSPTGVAAPSLPPLSPQIHSFQIDLHHCHVCRNSSDLEIQGQVLIFSSLMSTRVFVPQRTPNKQQLNKQKAQSLFPSCSQSSAGDRESQHGVLCSISQPRLRRLP